jgi:serine/threonine protein kinase
VAPAGTQEGAAFWRLTAGNGSSRFVTPRWRVRLPIVRRFWRKHAAATKRFAGKRSRCRLADESRRRRFLKEARAASSLNHPNIVTIHEIESFDGLDAIVMELVSGETLTELIRRRVQLSDVLRLAIPVADALARARTLLESCIEI